MNTTIIKVGKEYKVELSFGNQFFTLDYRGTKMECVWMVKMVRKCFKNYADYLVKKELELYCPDCLSCVNPKGKCDIHDNYKE